MDAWDDIESDLSVFHRIPIGTALDTPPRDLWRLVDRIGAYDGVVRFRVAAEQAAEQDRDGAVRPVGASVPLGGPPGPTPGARVVTPDQLVALDNGAGWFGPDLD